MSRRAAGVTFCAIAAFLLASGYLAAGIAVSGFPSTEPMREALDVFGSGPLAGSVVALAVGVAYLLGTELAARRGGPK